MNLSRSFTTLAISSLVAFTFCTPSISKSSVRAYHSAITEANHGEISRAKATLGCLLMPAGLTIGLQGDPDMRAALRRGIEVWTERLRSVPFVLASRARPDLKVVFVRKIQSGGEVQGEVRCQRQVHWGSFGAQYRVKGTIYVCNQVNGRPISRTEAASVIEHELGHVLGLDDDTDPSHLMGPFVEGSPVDGPAPEEVSMVQSFRAALRDVLRQIEARSPLSSR
jgi:hypothetical protein